MRVAIIGGSGYVGRYVVDELLKHNHTPVLLVRPGSEHGVPAEGCEVHLGDASDPEALGRVIGASAAVIHLIGILRAFPKQGITFERLQYEIPLSAMKQAEALGVKRFLLMSANGVKADGTAYQRSKFQAEEALRQSSLEWTIFRPSVLFGDPRGRTEFATQLYRDIVAQPVPAPLFHQGILPFGAGAMEMSPIYVGDVAAIMVAALDDPSSRGETFHLGGPERISWKGILKRIAQATGHRTLGIPVPAWAVKLVAGWFESNPDFPITRDQITMLMEGNSCDSSEVFARFGITPTPFDLAHLGYLRQHFPHK